jgi:hypothetical protein
MLSSPAAIARRLLADVCTQVCFWLFCVGVFVADCVVYTQLQSLHAKQPAQTLAKSEAFRAWSLRVCYLQVCALENTITFCFFATQTNTRIDCFLLACAVGCSR